jgi:hypothetical protein
MRITHIGDIDKLNHALQIAFNGEVPENLYIECPELFDYARQELGLSQSQVESKLKIYGINVEREICKIY